MAKQLYCQQTLGASQRGLWKCGQLCRMRITQEKVNTPCRGANAEDEHVQLLLFKLQLLCLTSWEADDPPTDGIRHSQLGGLGL